MIFFFYGPDTYRSREKLKELKDKFLKEVDQSALNLTFLDGKKIKAEDFNSAIATPPFLARKRMVVVTDLVLSKPPQEKSQEIIKLLDSKNLVEDVILIFLESGEPDQRTTLFKRLAKEKYAQKFDLLNNAEMKNWLRLEIKRRGGKIDSAALDKLANLLENDLWTAISEIDKLIAYKAGELIVPKDVEEQVKGKFDDNIFNFVDAIANKNKKMAYQLLSDQLNSGANELYLLTMLIRQFRILLLVKGSPQFGKQQLAAELGIHPFVVQKALTQVKNFSEEKIKDIYRKLLDTDLKIKTSWADSRVLFDLLLSEILN